jgi:hypothetical protein
MLVSLVTSVVPVKGTSVGHVMLSVVSLHRTEFPVVVVVVVVSRKTVQGNVSE